MYAGGLRPPEDPHAASWFTLMMADAAFWRGRRVFVTGHTGFKGAWLCAWLRRLGATVRGYALAPDTVPNLCMEAGIEGGIDTVRADIRDEAALDAALRGFAPDIVLHLAAQALVGRGYAAPVATFHTNVMGTVNLLEAARRAASVRAILVVTSDKAYANHEQPWPYRETDALGGRDPYSASKSCAELVAQAWRQSFLQGRVATARAGNVIGGGDWSADRLVPDCIDALRAGRPAEIRNPRAVRPWQHVLDPLNGYLILAERLWLDREAVAEAWNFGPSAEDRRSVGQMADAIAHRWGDGARWVSSPPAPAPHEAGQLTVDSQKARSRLGWRPLLDVDTALGWTTEWYRRHDAGEPAAALMAEQLDRFMALSHG